MTDKTRVFLRALAAAPGRLLTADEAQEFVTCAENVALRRAGLIEASMKYLVTYEPGNYDLIPEADLTLVYSLTYRGWLMSQCEEVRCEDVQMGEPVA